ncbi:hypothetical protein BU15DRAFT_67497 [Melanogaster broomeanus]|nr:hypothetical protein BU15DRAFT_67497 [Melanogaster broomeanus]
MDAMMRYLMHCIGPKDKSNCVALQLGNSTGIPPGISDLTRTRTRVYTHTRYHGYGLGSGFTHGYPSSSASPTCEMRPVVLSVVWGQGRREGCIKVHNNGHGYKSSSVHGAIRLHPTVHETGAARYLMDNVPSFIVLSPSLFPWLPRMPTGAEGAGLVSDLSERGLAGGGCIGLIASCVHIAGPACAFEVTGTVSMTCCVVHVLGQCEVESESRGMCHCKSS